jgi:transposase
MRPPRTFIDLSATAHGQITDLLHGPWRTATRLLMVLLSAEGWSAAEIAGLLAYDPGTVRRWLHRFAAEGVAGLPDRPRPGRPRLGGRLLRRITALLATPGPWTIRRLWTRLGRPQISLRTLWRRTRAVAAWRRPRLVAHGDPDHDHIVAHIRRRIAHLPTGSAVFAATKSTWTGCPPCAPPGPYGGTATRC